MRRPSCDSRANSTSYTSSSLHSLTSLQADPRYARALKSSSSLLNGVQGNAYYKKVVPIVAPYVEPVAARVTASSFYSTFVPYFTSFVQHMTPTATTA